MDDFFSPSSPTSTSQDPTSDFLAREKALLGEQFGDPSKEGSVPGSMNHQAATTTNSATSGEKDFIGNASSFPELDDDDQFMTGATTTTTTTNGSRGGAAGAAGGVSITNHTELSQFENDYPQLEDELQPSSNGFNPSMNGNDSLFTSSVPTTTTNTNNRSNLTTQQTEGDSEFIRSWRIKQQEEIASREETSNKKKEETIVKAQNSIDNFYKEYNAKKEKNISKNKDEEAAFLSSQTEALSKGTTWERICQLIDLNDSRSKSSSKSKQDLTRFKQVLLELKREGENAPGAAGY